MDKEHDTQVSKQADLTANDASQGAHEGSLKPLFFFFGAVALIIALFLITEK